PRNGAASACGPQWYTKKVDYSPPWPRPPAVGLRPSRHISPPKLISRALARPSRPMRNSTGSVGSTVSPVDHVKLSRFTLSICPFKPPRTALSLPSWTVTVTSPNKLSVYVPTYASSGSAGMLDPGAGALPRPPPAPRPPPPPRPDWATV